MNALDFVVPLRTSPGGNNREHFMARHRRVNRERAAVHAAWPRACGVKVRPLPPVDVLLVRIKPRGKLLDSDNLTMSLKSVRDQVARELGVDDGDVAHIRFRYSQHGGPWGVRISIRERQS